MKWLVTGASGFLGYHVCKFLIDNKVEVVATDINDFPFDDLKDKVKFHKGDITDAKFLRKITKGIDIVMHGAAALPRSKKDVIWAVNFGGTKNVLKEANKNKVKRVIFISTTAVYGIPKEHPIYETAPLPGVGPYGDSKVESEKLCAQYRDRMIVSIIRPKTFVGSVRLGIFSVLFDWVYRGKKLPVIGNGKNQYQLLDVDDLANAIWILSKTSEEKANGVYNVGAKDFGTINDHMQKLIDYRKKGKLVHFPSWTVKTPLRILDKLGLSPLYAWAYETLDKDHFVSIDKMQNLGWEPKFSSEQTLLESYKWYEKHRKEIINKKGTTHTVQWNQGILGLIRKFF
ncbi:MAG: NAD(P)-dependent oxidoreductase [Candidatus Altiarchaeota archaeon]|nr:NAD(P)-dependent oxidoreductase [Candidatus Altiarchaeota archaeon]